ncbi:MAG: DUF4242 domain-containing protein [Haliea sp.]|jgi:hypothetical protein|nr:DUF4242 domain-containing protein [Haliea sp.]
MADIILERQFNPALSPDGFRGMAMESVDCLNLYRVEWMESLLAEDGSRLLCRFTAPDTEAVRMVAKGHESSAKTAWPGTIHDTGRKETVNVVVERQFDAPVTVEALQAIENAGAWCMDLHQVTFLRTFFSSDCKRMICLYQAPDAESVRLAQRQAKMPLERVWSCRGFTCADFTDT